MPIYEYACGECGHRLEALQKLNEAPLTDCPECRAPALDRLISAAAFRLKGGGWYETDFKKSGAKRNVAQGEGEAQKKPEESTSGACCGGGACETTAD
ncbi:MAG: zinc ribbon domain-containing protein [Gammaproteobacteria bacterium]|nr:zinc ribbon domain-containing protein [Gammaproteobacteria bacterium]